MDPIAFTIFGISIRWYGILIGLGVVIALTIARINFKKKGLDFEKLLDIFMWAFPMAIVGARLYYVIFEFQEYRYDFIQIFDIRAGGLAVHGGLIFGIGTAYIYCKKKNIDFLRYLDTMAPSIILAQSIGRWGNFFNQEAHGGEVSKKFISHFPKFIQNGMNIGGTYYHPTFLYESLWDLLIFIVLIIILYTVAKKWKGITIYSYIVLYSIGRFFIEKLRTDSLYFFGIRIAQLISIIGIVAGILLILITINKKNKLVK